jgi:hypothetical protein
MPRLLIVAFALLLLPTAAAAEWYQAETPHFIVHADAPPETVAGYARELEALDSLMRTLTGTPAGGEESKLDLYMLDDIAAIRRLLSMPPNAGAIFAFGPMGQIAVVGRTDRANPKRPYDYRWPLFHEYGHYFMTKHLGRLQPFWFIEGFASLFESVEFPSPNLIRIGALPPARQNLLEYDRWLPLRSVLSESSGEDEERNVRIYAQGWLLSHHLYFGGSRRAELEAYLGKIRSGQPLGDLDAMFGGGLAGLDSEMRNYGRASFATRDVPFAPLADSQVRVVPMSPGAAAMVELQIRATQIDGYQGLDSIYAEALPIARKYPDDREAAEFAAWLAFDAADFDTARKLIAPIMSAPAPGPHLLTLNGRLIIREALDGAEAEQFGPIVLRGRRSIEQALKLAPNDPLVLEAMFDSYDAELTATPASAYRYLARAVEAAPSDFSLRFRYAEHMVKIREFAAAADILRAVANAPHMSREKLKAQAYILELEKRLGRRPG